MPPCIPVNPGVPGAVLPSIPASGPGPPKPLNVLSVVTGALSPEGVPAADCDMPGAFAVTDGPGGGALKPDGVPAADCSIDVVVPALGPATVGADGAPKPENEAAKFWFAKASAKLGLVAVATCPV